MQSTTRTLRFAFPQHEADAAHRVNEPWTAFRVDLLPEARHLHVDNVVEARRSTRLSPHFACEHFTRDEVSLMSQQVLEQLEFARRQLEQRVAAGDAAGDQIELQVCSLQTEDVRWPAAPKQRTNACKQLRQGKRLDQ